MARTIDDEQTMDETPTVARTPHKEEEKALDVTSFDLASWVDGVQPVTHAVTLYARGDLVADLDRVTADLKRAKLVRDLDAVGTLTAQAKRIVDELEKSALDVVVAGWSSDRISGFRKTLEAEGVTGTDLDMEQVAAQIVSPEGFTADHLRELITRIEPQVQQVIGAVAAANTHVPTVSVPF